MKCFTHRTLAWTLTFIGTVAVAQAQFEQQGTAQPGTAQQQTARPQQAEGPPKNAIATVNGEAITASEVQSALDAQMQQAAQAGQVDPNAAQQIRQQVMNTLVESRLVEQYLREQGPQVAGKEVQAVIDRYKEQFQSQGVPFEQFLASSGYTKSGLEKRIKGSLAWQKYQQKEATDAKLQQHFAENQERFPADDFEQAKPLVAQSYASELWQEIVKEKLPEAEIEMVNQSQPGAQQSLPNTAPQQQQQR